MSAGDGGNNCKSCGRRYYYSVSPYCDMCWGKPGSRLSAFEVEMTSHNAGTFYDAPPRAKTAADLIDDECNSIKEMLHDKNTKYGNSALEPLRIASKASADEQLLTRIDDKLSRWKTAAPGDDEDVIKDLIGYLVMLRISRKITK